MLLPKNSLSNFEEISSELSLGLQIILEENIGLISNLLKLKNSIDYTSFQTIKKKSLTVFLDEIIIELNFISILIGKVFFSQKYL